MEIGKIANDAEYRMDDLANLNNFWNFDNFAN